MESVRQAAGGAAAASEARALMELAGQLAEQAGQLAQQCRRGPLEITTKSSPTDVVSNADRAVETFLRDEISRRFPQDAVLGEEQGETTGDPQSHRWIIDPIDGTVNYLLGFPFYAVSVAVEHRGQVVAAAVAQPAGHMLFQACLGGGAFLDGQSLTGPRSVPVCDAVVATGFGYQRAQRVEQGRVVGQLVGQVGNLRRAGSAALDLCSVAAGWVDMYYESSLGGWWDIAAGLLIAQEAGAVASDLWGQPAGADFLAVAHPDRIAEFRQLLQRLAVSESS